MTVFGTTRLLLARHGRTRSNAEGRVQGGGWLDSVGRSQARALCQRLAREPLAAIYSSPLTRAKQTARVIARSHGLPVRLRGLLRDIDYGVYASALLSEARAQDPELWRRWFATPHTVHFPGGESLADLRRRMERFLEEVRGWSDRSVLAVCHDSPIRVLASIARGEDDTQHNATSVGEASLTVIDVTPEGPALGLYGDVAHLEGLSAA